MKRLLAPLTLGVDATRHLIWYLSYQVTGEAREITHAARTNALRCRATIQGGR